MGQVERFVQHDCSAASDEFQQAVDLRPNDSKALGSLAIVEGWLGNEEAAIKALRQAVALDPQTSFCLYALGLQLAGVGDYAAARQAQRRALVIDPQHVQAYLPLDRQSVV